MTFESIKFEIPKRNARYINNVIELYHFDRFLKLDHIENRPFTIKMTLKMKDFITPSKYEQILFHLEDNKIRPYTAAFYVNTEGEHGIKKWIEEQYKNGQLQNTHINSKEVMSFFHYGTDSLNITKFLNRFMSKHKLLESNSESEAHAIYRLEISDITRADTDGFMKILREMKNHTYFLKEGTTLKDLI